ncbi:oligosaccharide biosynthesis protein Alg14 like protein, partial [Sistotremastrum niveocremeum HHB9708]
GGHTSEMFAMISALDVQRYKPRLYLVSEGDTLSADKAYAFESRSQSTGPDYYVKFIPRARKVHQSLLSTPFSALVSLWSCLDLCVIGPLLSGKPFTEVVILNGPGTCVMICLAIYIARVCGLKSPRMIYVESFARVSSLSLSGKLLRPFVDRFIVQWPHLLKEAPRSEHRGWLV